MAHTHAVSSFVFSHEVFTPPFHRRHHPCHFGDRFVRNRLGCLKVLFDHHRRKRHRFADVVEAEPRIVRWENDFCVEIHSHQIPYCVSEFAAIESAYRCNTWKWIFRFRREDFGMNPIRQLKFGFLGWLIAIPRWHHVRSHIAQDLEPKCFVFKPRTLIIQIEMDATFAGVPRMAIKAILFERRENLGFKWLQVALGNALHCPTQI